MIITEVWVPGHPRTKGSLTAKGGYAKDTVQSSRWRAMMAEQVRRDIAHRLALPSPPNNTARNVAPYAGPVDVELVAFLPAPASVLDAHGPVGDPPAIWHGAGDIDKLARNVLDAIASDAKSAIMNGGAIVNDNQVVRLVAEKYAAPRHDQGLWLHVAAADWINSRSALAQLAVNRIRRAAVR